jgi:sigma-B regulation protein RsbU (phosphoserine phosphatase)
MAMCRSVLRSIAADCLSPAAVLRDLNRKLYPDIREDMFITMTYMVVDPAAKTIKVARAGHEAPLIYRHAARKIEAVSAPGLAVGIDNGDVFDEVIEDVTVILDPLDTLVLYTDGVTEATDEEGQDFGRENLKEALLASGAQSVDFLVKNVVERVQRFSRDAAQSDDITLVALQRSEPRP